MFPQDIDFKRDLKKSTDQSGVHQIQILLEEALTVWEQFRHLPNGAR